VPTGAGSRPAPGAAKVAETRLRGFLGRIRHTQLLVFLGLMLLLRPFLSGEVAAVSSDVMLLFICLSAVFAYSDRPSHVVVGSLLTVAVQVAAIYRQFQDIDAVSVAYSGLAMVFFMYFCGLILRSVFRARDVSLDTIAGALAAYLLLGVIWAFAYALLESQVPGSFVGLRSTGGDGYAQYLSYSFVTLTTLGYGNVVPGNAKADSLAIAEAISGQFYLTVLVARLVAMSLSAGRAADPSEEPEEDATNPGTDTGMNTGEAE
jgi:hypothetical protein